MAAACRSADRPGATERYGRVWTSIPAAPGTKRSLRAFATSAGASTTHDHATTRAATTSATGRLGRSEAAVARFDGQEYLVVSRVPLLQQPDVVALPQHIPAGFAEPPPMPAVDWAVIAGALFEIVERENRQRAGTLPNQYCE